MNYSQLDFDSTSTMRNSENEIEYVDVKMEIKEEMDLEQMLSESNTARKTWNEVDSFSYQSSIIDPLLIKEEQQLQDEANASSAESPALKDSIADNADEQSGDTVVGAHSLNQFEVEQPASSPFFNCTQCDYKCTRLTVLNKHIRTHHVAAKSSENGVNKTTKQSTSKHLPTSSKKIKLLICEICDYKTKRPNDLRVHLRKHTGEKPFSCELCDFKAITLSHLKVHLRKHTGEKPFSCELCDFKATVSAHLKEHIMVQHTGEKPFSCELCEYKTYRSGRLKDHMKRKHPSLKNPVNQGQLHQGGVWTLPSLSIQDEVQPMSDNSPFLKHFLVLDPVLGTQSLSQFDVEQPASSPSFSCTQCDHKCTTLTDLNIHIRTHHVATESSEEGANRTTKQSTSQHLPTSNIEINLLSCELCDYKTKYQNNLKNHVRRHVGGKPFICEFCAYRASKLANLKVHLKTHTGEKPFSCELCDFKAITSSHLKVHLRKHTGEKPFSCELCDFKATVSTHLKVHMRQHTGEKPYSCELCDFKGITSSQLKVHMRQHTGEKPFSCELCEYKTIRSGHLKLHMRRKHTLKNPLNIEVVNNQQILQ